MESQSVLRKLNSILPLKTQQKKLDDESRLLHREILKSFIQKGRILNDVEMQKIVSNPKKSLQTLAEKDLIVLDKTFQPISAYPFTMQERVHNISVNNKHIYALCALDSLAISPMFDFNVEIKSVCDISDAFIDIIQHNEKIINASDNADVHIGIHWGSANSNKSCADSLCNDIVFLKGLDSVSEWNALDYEQKQILTLEQAVKLAADFFTPIYAQ